MPSFVSLYWTFGGTTGCTVPVIMPSRSTCENSELAGPGDLALYCPRELFREGWPCRGIVASCHE